MFVAKLDFGRILGRFFGPFLILLNRPPGFLILPSQFCTIMFSGRCYARAAQLQPDSAGIWHNLALNYHAQAQDAAGRDEVCLQKCIREPWFTLEHTLLYTFHTFRLLISTFQVSSERLDARRQSVIHTSEL